MTALDLLLSILAVVGCVALVLRLGRSLLGLGIAAAEATALAGSIEVSTRRGDLTAMGEQQSQVQTLRRRRLRSLLLAALWAALLVVPPMIGWVRVVYAAAAVLWILPSRPVLIRRVRQ